MSPVFAGAPVTVNQTVLPYILELAPGGTYFKFRRRRGTLMRGEALILNFGELKRRLLEGDAYFREGANSNNYIILFYLKIEDLSNDIMKSKLTE